MKNLFSAVLVVACFAAGSVRAAGFLLDTQSARAIGMGNAVTAFIDEPSAIYYNPAGLVRTEGLQVQAGVSMILPQIKVDPVDPALPSTSLKLQPQFPPHGFISYRVHDMLAVGLGFYVPFGDDVRWPDGWFGQAFSIHSKLQNFYITPSVSVKVIPRVRVGVGFDIVRGTVQEETALLFPGGTAGNVNLGGGAWGTGANAGVQVDIIPDRLVFGTMYKSSVDLTFTGKAHFSNIPIEFSNTLVDQGVKASFVLPSQLQMGLSGKPIDRLRLALDVGFVDWNVFKSITINFDNPTLTTTDPKNWSARWNVRGGAEFTASKDFRVRAGAKYDPSPSPSNTLAPNLPDANRVTANVGGSFVQPHYQIDLSYQATVLTRTPSTWVNLPATYSGVAHVATLTARYKF